MVGVRDPTLNVNRWNVSPLLEAVEDRYDFVLFDCPPALRSLTTATIYAADHVVVVVEPSKEFIDGSGKLIRYFAGLTKLLQREPSVAGAIITNADPREILVRDARAGLEATGRFPWIQSIYLTVGFKDADTESKPLVAIASRARINSRLTTSRRSPTDVPVVPT